MIHNELIWKAIKTFEHMSNCIEEESEIYFKKEFYDIFNKTIVKVVPDLKIEMNKLTNNDTTNYYEDTIDEDIASRVEEIMEIFQEYDFLEIGAIKRVLRILKNIEIDPDYYKRKSKKVF